ncbi:hypothetical protein [Kineococcus aurantiacus]|uniref:Uncharacterized protein n=1 Tax=Kineococcus aurantiacus TaxID=37633 RepID=A0A7Y9DMY6_9ACTN|nr:hypothetical protein [Kineococcus aurantiacus]NYD23474.1 hypothetical protein [Kineococcus aurantiacus]
MNQSIWERRQAVASRLEGQVKAERVVRDEFAGALAAASLDPAHVDPDGHLGRAVAAVAHLAAGEPGYDLVLSLPTGVHGARVHADADGRVTVGVVPLGPTPPEPRPEAQPEPGDQPTAVASELAALLWRR